MSLKTMPADLKSASGHQSPIPGTGSQPASLGDSLVLGIYGLPGSGKSTLLAQLKLAETPMMSARFTFIDGSELIDKTVPGGLEYFKTLDHDQKQVWRSAAIKNAAGLGVREQKVPVVAGHFMLPDSDNDENPSEPRAVCTAADMSTYTHIIYLDVPAAEIATRRQRDTNRKRPDVSVKAIHEWQETEKKDLRALCAEQGVFFTVLDGTQEGLVGKVSKMLDFLSRNEMDSIQQALKTLDKFPDCHGRQTANIMPTNCVLVLDADRTLAPQDSGRLFFQKAARAKSIYQGQDGKADTDPLRTHFKLWGYSDKSFRHSTLMYEEAAVSDEEFDALCVEVAAEVKMYPQFISLLQCVQSSNVRAVIVTSGLRRVWEKVLEREGLRGTKDHRVIIVGAGRIGDSYVVTPKVKQQVILAIREGRYPWVVDSTRKPANVDIWAFGDSPLDLPMLQEADHAVVVVGEEDNRSKTMDEALKSSISRGLLRQSSRRQLLLPDTIAPRIDTDVLPLIDITSPEFTSIFNTRDGAGLYHFTATCTPSAALLSGPMRDATIFGPALREAHSRAGWWLATTLIGWRSIIGMETRLIPHVQGGSTQSGRLLHENKTLIVALMRGGEPMAYGVSEAFPGAMLLHAKDPVDVKRAHLAGKVSVLLVDSVINKGDTVLGFVEHIRSLHGTIRIVLVAGVVQVEFLRGCKTVGVDWDSWSAAAPAAAADAPQQAAAPPHQDQVGLGMGQKVAGCRNVRLVALRVSRNKYTGKGPTDTGHRLFNSTQLD